MPDSRSPQIRWQVDDDSGQSENREHRGSYEEHPNERQSLRIAGQLRSALTTQHTGDNHACKLQRPSAIIHRLEALELLHEARRGHKTRHHSPEEVQPPATSVPPRQQRNHHNIVESHEDEYSLLGVVLEVALGSKVHCEQRDGANAGSHLAVSHHQPVQCGPRVRDRHAVLVKGRNDKGNVHHSPHDASHNHRRAAARARAVRAVRKVLSSLCSLGHLLGRLAAHVEQKRVGLEQCLRQGLQACLSHGYPEQVLSHLPGSQCVQGLHCYLCLRNAQQQVFSLHHPLRIEESPASHCWCQHKCQRDTRKRRIARHPVLAYNKAIEDHI
mmetsp:Transcript_28806/g.67011  ORF Transcript_28806/g.67011 Transcript_28806/m.67011 type:complete len:328 (+) Transcript_28806:516-1499(+)